MIIQPMTREKYDPNMCFLLKLDRNVHLTFDLILVVSHQFSDVYHEVAQDGRVLLLQLVQVKTKYHMIFAEITGSSLDKSILAMWLLGKLVGNSKLNLVIRKKRLLVDTR